MLEFPLINDTSRKIIHIDMDAFFAQVVTTRLENTVSTQPCLLRKPTNVVPMLSLFQEIIAITVR